MDAQTPTIPNYTCIKVRQVGNIAIAEHQYGRYIDENIIQDYGSELWHLIKTSGFTKIILSFHNVEYYAAPALGKIITADRKAKTQSIKLKLCNIRPEIMEVFYVTKLDQLFDINDNEASALASFK